MAPIDLDDLLRGETSHVEWKKQAAEIEDVVKSLTAFANDLDGSGQGGWVVCGVEGANDDHGFPTARRVGLAGSRFKEVQGTVLDWCRERVSPPILPSVEVVGLPEDPSRRILVFHVEASGRVHAFQEKDGRTRSWVRHDSKTVVANKELLRQLQERKGEVTPFLQRPCSGATLDDLDLVIAREFLLRAKLPHPPEEYLKPGARLDAFSYPLVLPSGTRAVTAWLAS